MRDPGIHRTHFEQDVLQVLKCPDGALRLPYLFGLSLVRPAEGALEVGYDALQSLNTLLQGVGRADPSSSLTFRRGWPLAKSAFAGEHLLRLHQRDIVNGSIRTQTR